MIRFASFVVVLLGLLLPSIASAQVIQAPVGGKPVPLGAARVACATTAGAWTVEPGGHAIRPPTTDDTIGQGVALKLAADPNGCATTTAIVTLVTTGPWPQIDGASVALFADEGRLDVRGRHLRGVGVAWKTAAGGGMNLCQSPRLDPNSEQCSWAVPRGLPVDPANTPLSWVPPGARIGTEVSTFDAEGKIAQPQTFLLAPSRIVLAALLPPDSAIDLSRGRGEVQLLHPEAVASVDCGQVRCELVDRRLVVKGLSSALESVDIRFRLAPHVFLQKKEGVETTATAHLPVLHCPLSIASGLPLRGVESAKTVVRLEGRCAREASALRFLVGNTLTEVLQSQVDDGATDVVLRLGAIDAPNISITAVRADDPTVTVGAVKTDMQSAPQVRATLELPGYPNNGFIPNNRDIVVHFPKVPTPARLVVLPIEGVYSVHQEGAVTTIRGDANAAGLTPLRFGYRVDSLPGELAGLDLAVLTDPLQRGIHEANLPVPIGPLSVGPNPLIEFVCAHDQGAVFRVMPGETAHLPFDVRDNCRLIFHRRRLSPEYGTQKLSLDIEVVNADGNGRAEGHVSQTIVLRSGEMPRFAYIHGVKAPFDRVIVRLSQAPDEAHYVGALEIPTGAPDLKWTAVLGTGHARLYATSAIPTGLYRFGDAGHSGVLSLNFGILSRLTWLDREGHEGFLGLEAGIMAIGLTDDKSATGQSLTQVGLVAGIGISVPIANRSSPTEAAINLHAWVEEDISRRASPDAGSRFAIIFGPSISIGNVGANL